MINNHKSVRWRRIFSCNLLFLIFTLPLTAQDLLVTGKVTDGQLPISGANVIIKNTKNGVVTNFDGRYNITTKATDTLQISYLGYNTVTIPVQNRTSIDVILQEDATALGEVRINAGYYTTTDREKTGSISRITAKEIEKQPVNNPLEAMQGRMTGVDIVQTSGVAGSGFEVRIRGQNSIMAGNEPLYVIDGVPFDSQSLGSSISSGNIIPLGNISPLNAINPASIESIEVLKDADATAIYGSRGANGVVLITTIKGKAGKTKLSLSSNTGIAYSTKKRDLLNTEQYLEMRREAFANDGILEYPNSAYDVNGTWSLDRDTDWQEVLIGHTANTNRVQALFSGGSESTSFLINGMYNSETSVFPGSFKYDRITFNSSLQHTGYQDKLKLNLNVGYTLEDNLLPRSDLSNSSISLAPNAPSLYDDSGNLNWENGTWDNPLGLFENKYNSKSNTLFSSLVLSYNLLEPLDIKLNAGYNNTLLKDHGISPNTAYNPTRGITSANSMVITNDANKKYWILEPQISWNKSLGNGFLNLLFGGTFQKQEFDQFGVYGIGFPTNTFITNLSAATTILVNNEVSSQYNTQSWFARINYAHRDKLFINFTGRRDGSSRFGTGNKYGNFGALGAAYVFSDDLNINWLDFGKIRANYGITGNDQIGDYQYLQTYTITNHPYDGNIGLQPARLYNPNFKWEENRKSEIALETSFLKNKVSFAVAIYKNRSSNQLINYALPATTGFNSILANLDAKVENKGLEFDLKITPLNTQSFKWTSSINLSLSRNKLLEFPNLDNSTYANKYVIGKPLSIVKLYKLNGVNPETGLFEFEDYNNDERLTGTDDKKYTVNLTPKYFGGFSNTISYKSWELDVFFQFVNKKGYNQYRATQPAGTMANQSVSVLDRWQRPGDIADMQRLTTGADPFAITSYYQFIQSNGVISDASFVRLKSLTLAHTLSLNSQRDTTCRVFLSGQNLLTFTKFKGGDPEQVYGNLPPLAHLIFGFQLNL